MNILLFPDDKVAYIFFALQRFPVSDMFTGIWTERQKNKPFHGKLLERKNRQPWVTNAKAN